MRTAQVSILIPAYNAEPWIADTLESALAQTWPSTEIIVVDDGSRDQTLAVARGFESARVKVIAQDNAGAGVARNTAFAHCQGDFIQYLDADDLLAPNKIECQLQELSKYGPKTMASGAWGRFRDGEDPANAKFHPEPVWKSAEPIEWLVCAWTRGGMMQPAAWLSPRAVCELAGPWMTTRCPNDDGEYFCRVILASSGVVFVPRAKTYYRSGIANSLSQLRSRAALESLYEAAMLCQGNLLAAENSPRTRNAAADFLQRLVFEAYPTAPHVEAAARQRVRELGGSDFPCSGGPLFQRVASVTGWKAAKNIQRFASSLRLRPARHN